MNETALLYQQFLESLSTTTFSGEIRCDYASRLAVSTDNSIYQVIPQAVLFPRSRQDVQQVMQVMGRQQFRDIKLVPRGGGTAPNGQSLSTGIVLDFTKYMNAIIDINVKEGWVTVQPGIVLGALNDQLKPYSMCFAPRISTENRATIGGMVGTNACGLGSLTTGRTLDHVISLDALLADGSEFKSECISEEAWVSFLENAHSKTQNIYKRVYSIAKESLDEYKKLPNLPRGLGSYYLSQVITEDESINLNAVLCGSEGTLAVMTACKLKLTPIPYYRCLVVVQYAEFADALQEQALALCDHISAAEIIDDHLVSVLKKYKDNRYQEFRPFIEHSFSDKPPVKALNLIEFTAHTQVALDDAINQFSHQMHSRKSASHKAIDYQIIDDPKTMERVWALRAKGVEIVTQKRQGSRQPIPFIEDTAVSPEQMTDYILELRNVLDRHQLSYGMYGHLDAGCIHVRPALDLRLPEDVALLRRLFNEVKALLNRYGGVMWGEHGKGFRGECGRHFLGEALYEHQCSIKKLFDPYNQLNPGKIATPFYEKVGHVSSMPVHPNKKLLEIDSHLRGVFDRQISSRDQKQYSDLLACNGNGLCFDYRPEQLMCPSFKATRDRIHSPKGRSALLREWLRKKKPIDAFAKEVYDALQGCLGCKACSSICPVNVDIPRFRSQFLSDYHQSVKRPLRDGLIAYTEPMAYYQSLLPVLSKSIIGFLNFTGINKNVFKLVRLPSVSKKTVTRGLRKRRASLLSDDLDCKALESAQRDNSILLVQDAFSSFYHAQVFLSAYDFFTALGMRVYVVPFYYSGKPLYHTGYREKFKQVFNKTTAYFNQLAQWGIPIIGIEPSITLFYRDEYNQFARECENCIDPNFHIFLPEEWLASQFIQSKKVFQKVESQSQSSKPYYLFEHCTEQASHYSSLSSWVKVFEAFNLPLKQLTLGCCGMAGVYGHEKEHYKYSKYLFDSSWLSALVEHNIEAEQVLATGYSCRHQAKRMQGFLFRHPLEVLADHLKDSKP